MYERKCSRSCGRGCTKAEYERAKRDAGAMVRVLDGAFGRGWKQVLHENLGWFGHAASRCGRLKVHIYRERVGPVQYTAYLSIEPGPGGLWTATDNDPVKAAKAVIAMADQHARSLTSFVTDLKAILARGKQRRTA